MYWLIGGAAFLATFASAPIVRRLLIRYDIMDRPNERSSHVLPIPRGGGIACAFGMATGALVALLIDQPVPWAIFIAMTIVGLVGFLDDRYTLPVLPRLAAQILVGAVLGASLGGGAGAVFGLVLVPLIVNVVNFMDGINGITSLVVMLWGITAAVLGIAYRSPSLSVLGTLAVGSAAGFLPWNAPKAKLFLGDVGSYLFGTLIGCGILLGVNEGVPVFVAVAPLSVFLIDAGTTLLRRLLRRAPLIQAHREHVYQRLVDETGAPHILVSAWTTVVALGAVVAFCAMTLWLAMIVTSALLCVYSFSVPLWKLKANLKKRPKKREVAT